MYDLIRDYESFNQLKIDPSSPLFCDTETCLEEGLSSGGLYGQVRLFQIYQASWENAQIIDCFVIDLQDVLSLVEDCWCIFHNGSYDLHTINLKTPKTWVPKRIDDTLYLSRLCFNTKIKFSFYDCLEYAGHADDLIRGIDKKKEQKSDWGGPLSLKQKTYAACDVTYLSKLYDSVKKYQDSTVYKLDIQSLRLAVGYSRNGMPINEKTAVDKANEYRALLEKTLDELPINPRSSIQAREYLGTKSSDSDTLEKLIHEGNVRAKKIQTARHCYKSLEYLKVYTRPRVYGFFNPCAAVSGRFSCNGGDRFDHGNLQQMPGDLHTCVEASEGKSIIYNDYSGLELRMATAYTGEPTMSRMMIAGEDLHTETARFVFETDTPTEEERTSAKVYNFTLIYGGGANTIKNTLKVRANIDKSFSEVKSQIDKWFNFYPYFKEWHDMHKAQMNIYGYVDIETALGRHVRTYKLTDSLNYPIQGSSVEVTKTSLGLLFARYPDAHLINTIHDSNILEQDTSDAHIWKSRLSECMVDAWDYVIQDLAEPNIPMPHGGEIGPIWTFH